MRCNECKVDLGEQYTRCPLCGGASSDEPAKIEGIETAEYPAVFVDAPKVKHVERDYSITVNRLKAVFRI